MVQRHLPRFVELRELHIHRQVWKKNIEKLLRVSVFHNPFPCMHLKMLSTIKVKYVVYVLFSSLTKSNNHLLSHAVWHMFQFAEVFHLVFNLPSTMMPQLNDAIYFYSYSLSLNSFFLFCFSFSFSFWFWFMFWDLTPDIYEQC